MLKRTVIGFFGIRGKATSGQFPALQMILDALAAYACSRTPAVAATAFLRILFFPAVHQ